MNMHTNSHDFSTISPSAKLLLLLKAHTDVPYAKEAAKLIAGDDELIEDGSRDKDAMFWGRALHFEERYQSINQLLGLLPIHNILEISSGYSFRGLDIARQEGYHYIDTDLPEVIATKKRMIAAIPHEPPGSNSTLELVPLNALDASAFRSLAGHLPEGQLAIVNEGLLMYLNTTEKEQLCRIIHSILKEKGGYWITADIYIRKDIVEPDINSDKRLEEFFRKHHVEENKFGSIEEAEAFFKRSGFRIVRQAVHDYSQLSALPHLISSIPEEQRSSLKEEKMPIIRETWMLEAV